MSENEPIRGRGRVTRARLGRQHTQDQAPEANSGPSEPMRGRGRAARARLGETHVQEPAPMQNIESVRPSGSEPPVTRIKHGKRPNDRHIWEVKGVNIEI